MVGCDDLIAPRRDEVIAPYRNAPWRLEDKSPYHN